MLALTVPTTDLHLEWLEAHQEWGTGAHEGGAGLNDEDDVESPEGFQAFVARLLREADDNQPLPADRVHCSYRWMTEGRNVVGAIALRHDLNDFLLAAGGHIGYGVRPSARRRGLAGWALGQMLTHAWGRGMDRVLITCDENNEASRRTIERCGGVLEDVRDTALGRTRRYWVTDSRSGSSTGVSGRHSGTP